jgi:hypothetical protein
MKRAFFLIASLAAFPVLNSCGSGSSGGGTPPPAPSSVTVTPASLMLNKGGMQTFTATVNGTNDQSVFWEIEEAVPKSGDSAHGAISTGGVYIAPATVPTPASVTIRALSAADPTKSGMATVTLQAGPSTSVAISPGSGEVLTFGSIQFTATVTGNANTAVTWSVNGVTGGSPQTGSVTNGLYKAPNSVPVLSSGNNSGQTTEVVITATSQADPSSMDSVMMRVFPPQQQGQGANSPLGVSGGNANDKSTSGAVTSCCGGTLGALVARGGSQYVLSNNHILARSDSGTVGAPNVGDTIVQPGLIDNGCSPAFTAGTLSQFFNMETGLAPKIDAALALVGPGGVDATGTILQLGGTNNGNQPTNAPPRAGSGITPSQAVGSPHNGLVAKSGRSTGLTCSAIFSTSTNVSVEYQKGCGTGNILKVSYTNQIDVTNNGFSAEGDSGSLIVTQDSAEAVALLFAGSSSDVLGNPIGDVLNGLADPNNAQSKPTLVGTPSAHPVAACSLPGTQAAMADRLAAPKVVPVAEALKRALTVRDAHAPELMAYREMQAVGIGASYDNFGEPAILLFVTVGQPRSNLPAQIEGIRTRIVEGDVFSQRGAVSAAESTALEETGVPPRLVYPIAEVKVARAKIVHIAHADDLMKKAGVQGVGIGSSADAPSEAALVIFLIHGVPHDPIPPMIDGLRTRVRESSRFRAGFGNAPQPGCLMPPKRKGQPRPVTNSRPRW